MFTGIVEAIGRIDEVERSSAGVRLDIVAPDIAADLQDGQSVAVDGACLTVERFDRDQFTVFLTEETVRRTLLGERSPGDRVNLERAMPADGRFDGHLVQGHVDATTAITGIDEIGDDRQMIVRIPEGLGPYIVEKGSITLDGISLTIAERRPDAFEVALVPTTLRKTTLSECAVGDRVHVEIDIIAKYVESMLTERGVN